MLNKKHDINRYIIIAFAALFALLVLLAAYKTFSRIASRVSADMYYPYLKILKSSELKIAQQSLRVKDKDELIAMLEDLQKENMELASENARYIDLLQENTELRNLARIQTVGRLKTVYAECLLRDPLTWDLSFTIDKGIDDGIREGDPVVSATPFPGMPTGVIALVGRIKSASNHTAVVSTIYSRECRISVSLSKSKAYGIIQGTGSRRAENIPVKYLSVENVYSPGEIVRTSGFVEQTPSGIYIGTLEAFDNGAAAKNSPDNLYMEAMLKPAADINKIRFVAVLTTEPAEAAK